MQPAGVYWAIFYPLQKAVLVQTTNFLPFSAYNDKEQYSVRKHHQLLRTIMLPTDGTSSSQGKKKRQKYKDSILCSSSTVLKLCTEPQKTYTKRNFCGSVLLNHRKHYTKKEFQILKINSYKLLDNYLFKTDCSEQLVLLNDILMVHKKFEIFLSCTIIEKPVL